MQFSSLTLNTPSMIPAILNSQTYFFTVNHVTKETEDKLIYGIRLNTRNYFVSKTTGVPDCEQLDTNPPLERGMLKEIGEVMSEIELQHKKRPPLEQLNHEIFKIIARLRAKLFRK
jgi:hypothetical protein